MTPDLVRDLLALPPAASTMASEIDALHLAVISATMIGSFGVAAVAATYVVRHRRRPEERPLTPRLTAGLAGEIATIGGILSLFVGFWVVGYVQYVRMATPPDDAMTVYVTAKQWMWKFAYEDGRTTNDTLVVPRGKPVRLVMTSRDVIHSFFVPAFRVKHDVVPGRYETTWFDADVAGRYPLYCAEYCGTSHSMMLGEVVVLDDAAYATWRRLGDPLPDGGVGAVDDAVARTGERVAAQRGCLACHTLDGQRHVGPSFARLYGSVVDLGGDRRVVADEAYLTKSMMEPNADVVAGYKPIMPTYQGVLSAAESAELVALIRSLRDAPEEGPPPLPRLDVTPVDAASPTQENDR